MKRFTIWGKVWLRRIVSAGFWLLIWQLLSMRLPEILFAGPVQTVQSLLVLLGKTEFWLSIGHSMFKIAGGFIGAFMAGCMSGAACYALPWLGALVAPAAQIMKSVPVACFAVVALIWIPSDNISALVCFFVVFPVVFVNVNSGLCQTSPELLEMARVFHVPRWKRVCYLYLPQAVTFLLSGCRVAVGMAWKAGVAGEIIGLPRYSIGEQLYLSKLYLNTADLFAWTAVIIMVSLLCEGLMMRLLGRIQGRWAKTNENSVPEGE